MRLVQSSTPGAVERHRDITLLIERAVLTRALCRELLDFGVGYPGSRASVALSILLGWVQQNLPEYIRIEPHPSDGLAQTPVLEGCEDLVQEIRAGAQVGEAFFRLLTADNSIQLQGDEAVLRERLAAYWSKHAAPVSRPA